MCDCIQKLREAILAENPDYTGVTFELSSIGKPDDPEAPKKTGQRITIWYKKKVKNRTAEVSRKSFVSHSFCPFCGVAYKN